MWRSKVTNIPRVSNTPKVSSKSHKGSPNFLLLDSIVSRVAFLINLSWKFYLAALKMGKKMRKVSKLKSHRLYLPINIATYCCGLEMTVDSWDYFWSLIANPRPLSMGVPELGHFHCQPFEPGGMTILYSSPFCLGLHCRIHIILGFSGLLWSKAWFRIRHLTFSYWVILDESLKFFKPKP